MTLVQCKMARAALGWTVLNLAEAAQANKNTIVNFENGKDTYSSTANKLHAAFLATGRITFKDEGCVCVTDRPQMTEF